MADAIGSLLKEVLSALFGYLAPSLIFAVFVMFFVIQLEDVNMRTLVGRWISRFKKSRVFRWKFVFFTYVYILLYKTLFSRKYAYIQPFSRIMEGWVIEKTEKGYNFESIENILLFIPYIFLFFCSFYNYKKRYGLSEMIVNAFLISIGSSLFIELMQIIFNIGTLQISDIVYNTIGGIVGVIVFKVYVIIKFRR